ncbi:unnamed protein product [Rotaria sp. Silwood2]|nr:unnamed protein product [Rotaria sp. Silwood2]
MITSTLVHLIFFIGVSYELNNGLGRTPQMGWNSWNHFHRNISEKIIRQTVDAIVVTGLAAVGYQYVYLSLNTLDAGFKTCAGQPGSLGYETIDANTYTSWNVDYLKYDNYNTDGTIPEVRYPIMRDALNASG